MSFLRLMLLFFPLTAAAAETDFLVKVTSSPCGKRLEKVGSGSLVGLGGATFVLTSDHVVYHGARSDGICHSIRFGAASFQADLVAANFLNGMALLRVEQATETLHRAALNPERDFIPSQRVAAFGTLAGFPGRSLGLVADPQAQILGAASTRSVLPEVRTLLEVKGHSEFGMSGGALLDRGGRYAGLISHQYLRLRVGAPASPQSYAEGRETGEFVALAIPAELALAWMRSPRDVRLDLGAQLKGKSAVNFEGLRFTAQACKGNEAPVGGRADFGGEGAGIGGAETERPCRIFVTLDKGDYRFPFRQGRWFDSLKERLLAGGTAEIDGLYRDGNRYALPDFVAFFSAVANGYVPITKIHSPFVAETQVAQALKKLGSELEVALGGIAPGARSGAVARAYELTDAVRNGQWDLAILIDPKALAETGDWDDALASDFSATVLVRSKLLRIGEELAKIRL